METTIDKQKDFEYNVCRIFNFTKNNSEILQREGTEQMIVDDFNDDTMLSGTLAYKRDNKDFLLVVTKDSEVNHIEAITLDMIKAMLSAYRQNDDFGNPLNKCTLATNLPIDIHSSKAKSLKKYNNFHIENIGYSFCQKHNLKFNSIY